jgi:hypothetical protein
MDPFFKGLVVPPPPHSRLIKENSIGRGGEGGIHGGEVELPLACLRPYLALFDRVWSFNLNGVALQVA